MSKSLVFYLGIKIFEYDGHTIVDRDEFYGKFERYKKADIVHITIIDFSGKRE